MPYYESVFIVRQDVSTSQVEALTTTYAEIITKNGGKVSKTEQWGLRSLSYRIKKNKKGHYVLMNIDAPHEAVDEMERQMGLSEDILRCLTIRVDALDENPSVMMRRDEERPSRGRRESSFDRPSRNKED